MKRKRFTEEQIAFALLIALALITGCASISAAEPRGRDRHPNIIFILADDMGYGDVGALNPGSSLPTPHLDRLASEGVTFTDAHSPSAVCTPTRYGIMTGRYCWRGKLKSGVINGYGAPVIERHRGTVAGFLRSAGYHTTIVGKWHLGLTWPKVDNEIDFTRPVRDGPNAFGFDASYIIPASLDFPPYVYIRNGAVTDPTMVEQPRQAFPAFLRRGSRATDLVMEKVLDDLTDHAVATIHERASAGGPFFLYFALPAPHKPVLPHRRYRGVTGLGDYGDFVVQVDDAVGRLLGAIDEAEIAGNTLVIYTSDNGSFMYRYDDPERPDHVDDATVQGYRSDRHLANGPLRGTKADIWEAGHRVPFFVCWPGVVPAGERCAATICLTDFFATCAEIIGEPIGAERAEDSFSFLAPATGGEPGARPPVIHHSANGMFAIRSGRWKLVAGNGSGGREAPRGTPFGEPFQLFDLDRDPGETNDLIDVHPAIAAELAATLEQLRAAGGSRDLIRELTSVTDLELVSHRGPAEPVRSAR
ncbi:MAG: sulfatase family protein [Planctomycetota bacterium]|jgi:arylsulfatase A-like enzyme